MSGKLDSAIKAYLLSDLPLAPRSSLAAREVRKDSQFRCART